MDSSQVQQILEEYFEVEIFNDFKKQFLAKKS